MPRKRGSNRRRRRGRFGFLYKVLSILAICAVIVLALTLFFRVGSMEVSGNSRYTQAQIVEAAGVETGDNLFLLNKYSVANRLVSQLPYIEDVRINRRLPDTLLIDVTECAAVFAVMQEETAWLVSARGKIVESRPIAEAAEFPVVDGCLLLAPSVGSRLALSTQRQAQQDSLLSLLAALQAAELTDKMDAIHLDSVSELRMDYAGRFSVRMLYGADYERLLRSLEIVIERLESNQTGVIDLTQEGQASVRPS